MDVPELLRERLVNIRILCDGVIGFIEVDDFDKALKYLKVVSEIGVTPNLFSKIKR